MYNFLCSWTVTVPAEKPRKVCTVHTLQDMAILQYFHLFTLEVACPFRISIKETFHMSYLGSNVFMHAHCFRPFPPCLKPLSSASPSQGKTHEEGNSICNFRKLLQKKKPVPIGHWQGEKKFINQDLWIRTSSRLLP